MTVPSSLLHPDLVPVWQRVADHLARHGLDRRGVVRIESPAPAAVLALQSLTGGRPGRSRRSVDLAVLESALARVGAGDDLPSALAGLGVPVAADRVERRLARADAERARAAFRDAATGWPEPWASEWADDVVRVGLLASLSPAASTRLAATARRVVDAALAAQVPGGTPISRTEVAAVATGDAHALDPGTQLHQVVAKALTCAANALPAADGDGGVEPSADVWTAFGLAPDTVSAPALTWGLGGSHPLLAAARELAVPVHLSALALRAAPVDAVGARPVLVVENPRLVEAAAQRRLPAAVVCANGNPSTAVRLLVRQLLGGGVTVRYHGDFDAAGLAMCGRMAAVGAVPWRMDTADYVAAVAEAAADGVVLPIDETGAPPTPWCPDLQNAFDAHRHVVHEERLVADLLTAHAAPTQD